MENKKKVYQFFLLCKEELLWYQISSKYFKFCDWTKAEQKEAKKQKTKIV